MKLGANSSKPSAAALLAFASVVSLPGGTTPSLAGEKMGEKQESVASIVAGEPVAISGYQTGTYWWAHMDASPSEPGTLMVCGARTIPSRNAAEGFINLSVDYGRTWRTVLVDSSSGWVSEESCAFGSSGGAYFLASASAMLHGLPHHDLGRSRLYVSPDSGASWQFVGILPFVDYSSLAVDRSAARDHGPIYLFANDIDVSDPASGPGLLTMAVRDGSAELSEAALLTREGKQGKLFSATPTASSVLDNGIAVSAFRVSRSTQLGPRPWEERKSISEEIEFVRAGDGGRAIENPIPISFRAGLDQLSEATMAIDRSGGPYRGRIYVAWAQNSRANIVIVLAWSDDQGRSWRRRTVETLPDPPRRLGLGTYPGLTPPAVAVNKYGTVGLFWIEKDGQCPYLSESRDGGENFATKRQVAACEPPSFSDLSWYGNYLFAWPESEASEGGLVRNEQRVGVLIEMHVPSLTPTSMAADELGNFHPMWLALRRSGSELWTATVSCTGDLPVHRNFGGLVDVTTSVALEFTQTQFDALRKTFSVDVAVVNRGDDTLRGPFLLQPTRIRSTLGPLSEDSRRAESVTPCGETDAAIFVTQAVLRPGEKTTPVRMTVTLAKLKPTDSGQISVSLRVCGLKR
jgi:hypothetical protein